MGVRRSVDLVCRSCGSTRLPLGAVRAAERRPAPGPARPSATVMRSIVGSGTAPVPSLSPCSPSSSAADGVVAQRRAASPIAPAPHQGGDRCRVVDQVLGHVERARAAWIISRRSLQVLDPVAGTVGHFASSSIDNPSRLSASARSGEASSWLAVVSAAGGRAVRPGLTLQIPYGSVLHTGLSARPLSGGEGHQEPALVQARSRHRSAAERVGKQHAGGRGRPARAAPRCACPTRAHRAR